MLKIGVSLLFFIVSLFGMIDNSRALKLKIEKMKKEQRVALVIGNDKYYSKTLPNLKNPVNDAELMKRILEKRRFKVYFLENVTKIEFAKAIKKFGNELKRGGIGLFYFAGHGLQVDGYNYLVPTDADIRDKTDVEFEAIPLNYITKKMQNARNRLNIIILDACRSDPFSRGEGGGLAPVSNAKGIFVAYATEAGKVASDGNGRNGVFTKYLAENIVKPLTIEEVFKKTREEVSKVTNGEQFPGVYNQIIGEFYFTLPKIESSNYIQPDKEAWNLIKNSNSIKDIKYFLNLYPNSIFAPVAKIKLEQLQRKQKDETFGDYKKDIYDEFDKYKSGKKVVKTNRRTPKYFIDRFRNNKNGWSIRNDKNVRLDIKNGNYIFKHRRYHGSWSSYNTIPINQDKDFKIITAMRHISGIRDYSYGIMWGQDVDNCYFFGISDNGQYLYGRYINGEWKSIVPWTKSSYINQNNQRNVIAVKKQGNKLKLIINNRVVKVIPYEKISGNQVGFSIDNYQRVDFDYIKVYSN